MNIMLADALRHALEGSAVMMDAEVAAAFASLVNALMECVTQPQKS
jgi:hypothetical protein